MHFMPAGERVYFSRHLYLADFKTLFVTHNEMKVWMDFFLVLHSSFSLKLLQIGSFNQNASVTFVRYCKSSLFFDYISISRGGQICEKEFLAKN